MSMRSLEKVYIPILLVSFCFTILLVFTSLRSLSRLDGTIIAEGRVILTNTELLAWLKKDERRFLHAVYCACDLNRTTKFYTECFGMKLLRKRDVPDKKYSNAFLGFGSEDSHFALELTYNYGVDKYDIGTGFGHFAIATQDVYKMIEDIRTKGGMVTREPGPVKDGTTMIAFVKDPDGYLFQLIQRVPTPVPHYTK